MSIYEDHALKKLAEMIHSVVRDIGDLLVQRGYRSLGQYILEITKPTDKPKPASEVVESLVRFLPCLQDMAEYDDDKSNGSIGPSHKLIR